MSDHSERVREFYRKQGELRMKNQIVDLILNKQMKLTSLQAVALWELLQEITALPKVEEEKSDSLTHLFGDVEAQLDALTVLVSDE